MYRSQRAWKLSLSILLCAVVAAVGYYAVDRNGRDIAQGSVNGPAVITESYPVRDLVVSWNPHEIDIDGNFESLIDTMKENVVPGTWNDAHSLHADRDSLSLVVAQTKAGHDEVKELLRQLRSLHDMYRTRADNGTCGYCGKASLPEIGHRCPNCSIARYDPPAK